jgi:uncharacterized phage protein (TIGR01671 family)
MREILFRGKRIDNGTWVYGYYGVFKDNYEIFVPFSEEEEKRNEGHVFSAIGGLWNRVNPETIGQFTGLTDKNGTKIFEGDIIDASAEWWDASGPAGHDSPIIAVTWNNDLCGFDPFANYDCDCGVYICADNCKVIGNIYDNPELLEVW